MACTALNTVAVTNAGEVFIQGSNTYKQLGMENEPGKFVSQRIPMPFFNQNQCKVIQVACGSDHILALANEEAVFGWGRNDQGQLGMGYVSESIAEPTRVKTLPNQLTKKLYCGSNYSAVITQLNRLMVAGEMDGGKLGIGKAHLSGNCLSFREVPKLVNVK